MKFCVKLGKSATEALQMLCEAEHPLSGTTVSGRHSRSKAPRGDERSAAKRTEIRELIHELPDCVAISYGGRLGNRTENLNVVRVAEKFSVMRSSDE
jgi:hypothetical protein